MKLITVIVPVYNVEKYIEDCLDSILNQTIGIEHLEILVIDDCSPDNSIQLINSKYEEIPSLKIIKHNKNKGLGGARNTGLANCNTPYVFFLDSDDALYENALEKLYSSIIANKTDIAIGGINNYSEDLSYKSVYLQNENNVITSFKSQFAKGDLPSLNVVVWNKLYKKSLISNEEFLEKTYFEDEPYTLKICTKLDRVSFIDSPVYKYRRREGSITSVTFNENYLESIEAVYSKSLKILHEFSPALMRVWLNEKLEVVFRKFDLDLENKAKLFKTIECILNNYSFDCLIENNILFSIENYLYEYKNILSESGVFSRYLKFKWKVGIIIPTYNRADNILYAVKSALNQTYSNIEVIVVDDNGENSIQQKDTQSKLQSYIDSGRITYIKHTKRSNGAAARNTGIYKAECEYISFLDDDDEYLETKIAKSVNEIKNYGISYGGVYCGYIGWNSKELEPSRFKEGDLSYELLTLDYGSHYLCTNTALYRKSALLNINGFDESFNRHQDLEMNLRFFENNKIGVVEEALVKLRPNPTKTENWLEVKEFYKLKIKYLAKYKYIIERFDKESQINIYCANWFEIANRFENLQEFVEYGASIDSRNDLYLILGIKKGWTPKSNNLEKSNPALKKESKTDINSINEKLEDLIRQKQWYENTYESLPLWWKKIGAFIRKMRNA